MLQKIRYFLFLTAVLVVIVVAFQNHHEVDIDILFFNGRYPLTLLLLASSAVSFLLGSLWTAWRSRKRERAKHRAKSDTLQPETLQSERAKPDRTQTTPFGSRRDVVDELTGDAK